MAIEIKYTTVKHSEHGNIEVKYYLDEENNKSIILSAGAENDIHLNAQDIDDLLFNEIKELLILKLNENEKTN